MASIHDNRGLELLAIIWVFTALAVITVILKIFTRARILHTLDIDDFFIFFSLVNTHYIKSVTPLLTDAGINCHLYLALFLRCAPWDG